MSERWQAGNDHYLATSLRWLRLCLRRLVPEEPMPPPAPPVGEEASPDSSVWMRWFGGSAPSPAEPKLLLEAQSKPLAQEMAEVTAERESAAALDPPPALVLLAQRFGLSSFERDTILLSAAPEFDPSMALLYAQAQGSASRNYATFALALTLFEDPNWDGLAPQRPLRYARLVEVSQAGAMPLTSSPLRCDERVLNFLKGTNVMDERLSALLTTIPDTDAAIAPSQEKVVQVVLERLRSAAAKNNVPVVQLVGADVASRIAVAQQVSTLLNRRLYQMNAESLPTLPAELDTLARLWQRESLLLPVALYIETESIESVPAESQAVSRFLMREAGLIFLGVREATARIAVANFAVDVTRPTTGEQFEEWKRLLDAVAPVSPQEEKLAPPAADKAAADASRPLTNEQMANQLAGQFNLNLQQIRQAASLPQTTAAGETAAQLWTACREITRPRLDALAQRLDAKATWNDIVLPDEQSRLLRLIVGQVRGRHQVYEEWGFAACMSRGFGISALFAGESGVGKTMAAEVLANELQLNLYRIDLSAVVSKYIGETEKNLRRLFDAAELGGAILFFDEADALFGKRSEVKDSHDRYANIEINYLLQRMEAFSGLAILATNMKTALDPAFLRRLRFVVNFGFPSVADRKRIWQRALPAAVPVEALDYDRLARISITGGNIHSIALNAAFAAAQQQQPVTMPAVLNAVRIELRKLDKPLNEAELR